jgi:hypothetical protein
MRTTHNFMHGKLSDLLKENELEPIINKLAYLFNEEPKMFAKKRAEYYTKETQFLKLKSTQLYTNTVLYPE